MFSSKFPLRHHNVSIYRLYFSVRFVRPTHVRGSSNSKGVAILVNRLKISGRIVIILAEIQGQEVILQKRAILYRILETNTQTHIEFSGSKMAEGVPSI